MELRNCIRCGKVFMFVSKRVCPACQREMDELFEKVRLYVKKNPGATVVEIAEHFGVDEQLVSEFVREGRFDFVTEALTVTCERCGKAIRRGRLCENCAVDFHQEVQEALPQPSREEPRPKLNDQQRMYLAEHIVVRDRNRDRDRGK